jgi:hypothetical protein
MRPILSFLALVGMVTGCAVTSGDGQRLRPGSEAFADYVESVFRRQNEVATELALAIDDEVPGSDRFAALEDAELGLLLACRTLNELAEARREGESPGGLSALRRARVAPDCERATERADALL